MEVWNLDFTLSYVEEQAEAAHTLEQYKNFCKNVIPFWEAAAAAPNKYCFVDLDYLYKPGWIDLGTLVKLYLPERLDDLTEYTFKYETKENINTFINLVNKYYNN